MRHRWLDPHSGRWLTRDPAGYVDGMSLYGYVGQGVWTKVDPMGLWGGWIGKQLRRIGNAVSDAAGWVGDRISNAVDVVVKEIDVWATALVEDAEFVASGFVDGAVEGGAATADGVIPFWDPFGDAGVYDRDDALLRVSHMLGGIARDLLLVAAGLHLGKGAAGVAGRGKEYSHFIPKRYLPKRLKMWRSLWNGNYVTRKKHMLSDPYRYRFASQAWKAANPMPNKLIQFWTRVPYLVKGLAGSISIVALIRIVDAHGKDVECIRREVEIR